MSLATIVRGCCTSCGRSAIPKVKHNIAVINTAQRPYSQALRTLTVSLPKQMSERVRPNENSPIHARKLSFWGSKRPTDWNKAVSEAEEIVGYPTSFMSLRCLLSDELSNVALHMRKLVGTKHPLLKTARKFLFDGKHSLQMRGLLVLLIAKAAGLGPNQDELKLGQMVSGIYQSQRTLAEVVEMIHTANLLHMGVINLSDITEDRQKAEMESGNKMAVLSGDFLLANASLGLASLENTKVVEIISSAIGDLMEAEFSVKRDAEGRPMLPPGGLTMDDWRWLTERGTASLITKSCRAALMLSGHEEELQQRAATFGENLAMAHQLHEDLLPITRLYENNHNGLSVLSAPVVLHLQNDEEQRRAMEEMSHAPSTAQLESLLKKSGAVGECKALCGEYGERAMAALTAFPSSDAKLALTNMVRAVTAV